MVDTPSAQPEPEKPPGHRKDLEGIPERLLARLWQKRAVRQEEFRTSGGQRVRVLYSGRPGHEAGPDFRNALLEVEGLGLVQGDVEIHIRQQDWEAHGHHTDPNYNGVVLHAALELDSPTTALPSGQQAPTVSISSLLPAPLATAEGEAELSAKPQLWELLGRQGYPPPDRAGAMGELLDRAGDARFLSKSARFQIFLTEQPAEQTLYEGLLEALGYRHNQQPFLKLAMRAPYAALEQTASRLLPHQYVGAIGSWLLALAGLAEYATSPATQLPGPAWGRPLARDEWHLFRVRPANHPRLRILGAAGLIARFVDFGLVVGLKDAAQKGSTRDLTTALTVTGSADPPATLIGDARARDLAVNVVSPFLHGLAIAKGETQEAESYLKLYQRFGKLQDNQLIREMVEQLFDPGWQGVVTSARRQQGLIHLQRLLLGAS